jgi:hypothetical protein
MEKKINKLLKHGVDAEVAKNVLAQITDVKFKYVCIDIGNTVDLSKHFKHPDLVAFAHSRYFTDPPKVVKKAPNAAIEDFKKYSGVYFECVDFIHAIKIALIVLQHGLKGALNFRDLHMFDVSNDCLRLSFYY